MTLAAALALVPLAIWIYLLAGRGLFWLARDRDDADAPDPAAWPSVAAVVPARDEAETIARAISSLLAQAYPGAFRIVLVDDQSTDGTGDIARSLDAGGRLLVLNGAPRPPGWTGKLWAMQQGLRALASSPPDYVWFTDADIAHAPDNLRRLAARADAGGFVLVSQMAKLRCESFAEKLLIPAFVFFFQMIYPFAWVSRADTRIAAAAGGSMLARHEALERAGGVEAIRADIIDDCALARRMKRQGPIWLGLTERAVSLRPYPRLADIRAMVARSAYAQLRYAPLLVLGSVAGILAVYVAPLPALAAGGLPALAGGLAYLCMSLAFLPIIRFYRLCPLRALLLPLIALFYAAFTLDSAYQHGRGRGGQWKGRAQASSGI